MTKLVQLRPVKSKHAPEIAYQLLDIFSIFGTPGIFQCDNDREFVNFVIIELSEMWLGLKLVHGKPKHSQCQGSVERANRDIEDMLTTWLQSNLTTHWGDGLGFLQVMKNRAYHEGIKCSSYEAMFGQPLKVELKRSNLPDDATEDIFSEEELEKVVSGKHGDEQNNLSEDPVEEIHVEAPNGLRNDLVDMKGAVFVDVQKETVAEDLPSTEMVTEVARSPSMCVKRKNKIIEKRKTVKNNLKTQAFKMTRLTREKFPPGKVGDTVKVRVPDVDRGRCDSRNISEVIMEVHLTKDLYKIGTKDGIRNFLYTCNQFKTCTEGTVNISDVPSVNVLLRECAGKVSLFGGQRHKRCNCQTSCQNDFCSCRKLN